MLRIQTANLPAEQHQRLHSDFVANEQHYLRMRPELLKQYRGQWVAVHDGQVIAHGKDLFTVMDAIGRAGCHAFIALVGREDDVVFRVRRLEFSYDMTYRPFALPRAEVAFANYAQSHVRRYPDVIPDIGADLSVLPMMDAQAIDLLSSPYLTGVTSGVVGPDVATIIYLGHVEINGSVYPALIQAVPGARERLMGRDVLNHLRVTFDGPALKITFEV
jgi:predicted aspartyl protease